MKAFAAAMIMLGACLTAFPAITDKNHYINDRDKENYEKADFEKFKVDSKLFAGKKLKFEMVYNGDMAETYPYADALPVKTYYHMKHGESVYYGESDIPVVVSRRDRGKLIKNALGIEKGTTITVYGDLKKVKKSKNDWELKRQVERYFDVDDIFVGTTDAEVKDDAKLAGDSYQDVDAGKLDLAANKLIEKKIRIKTVYFGRDPKIRWELTGICSDDKFFQLGAQDKDPLKGISMICEKSDNIISMVSGLSQNDEIIVSGVLKKSTNMKFNPPQVSFYIIVDKVERPAGAAGQAPPPPPPPASKPAPVAKPASPPAASDKEKMPWEK